MILRAFLVQEWERFVQEIRGTFVFVNFFRITEMWLLVQREEAFRRAVQARPTVTPSDVPRLLRQLSDDRCVWGVFCMCCAWCGVCGLRVAGRRFREEMQCGSEEDWSFVRARDACLHTELGLNAEDCTWPWADRSCSRRDASGDLVAGSVGISATISTATSSRPS